MKSARDKAILVSVGSFYPDQAGGPANTVYWLTKGLVSKGIEVVVVTSDRGLKNLYPVDQWQDTEFGKVLYVATQNILLPWRVVLKTIAQLRNFETVYVTSVFYTLSFIIAPIAVLLGKRVFWSPRGELMKSALGFAALKKKFVLGLVNLVKSKVIFHSTSEEETQQMKDLLG
ncbi:MAG: hypothetical protein IT258_08345, partial [Saprospiraceae bacterium]|nr:hypothetical protein [Saprospiraceae bacterium]